VGWFDWLTKPRIWLIAIWPARHKTPGKSLLIDIGPGCPWASAKPLVITANGIAFPTPVPLCDKLSGIVAFATKPAALQPPPILDSHSGPVFAQ